jgi:hypothetical protein
MKLFQLLYSPIFHSLNTMDLFPFIVELELKDLLQLKHLPLLIVKLKVLQKMVELFWFLYMQNIPFPMKN